MKDNIILAVENFGNDNVKRDLKNTSDNIYDW